MSDASNVEALRSLKEDEIQPGIAASGDANDTSLNSSYDATSVGRHEYSRSSLLELNILFRRTMRNIVRCRSLLAMHIVISVIIGVCGGLIFQGVTPDLAGFQNRTGAIYFMLTFYAFASFSSIDLFIAERKIIMREAGTLIVKSYLVFSIDVLYSLELLRLIYLLFRQDHFGRLNTSRGPRDPVCSHILLDHGTAQ